MIFHEAFIPMSAIIAWEDVGHPLTPREVIARWTHIPAERIEDYTLESDIMGCGFIIRRLKVKL